MATKAETTFPARHAAWERVIAARGHIAWCPSYTTRFLSAWGVFQRYCHLNGSNGRELIEPRRVRPGYASAYEHRYRFTDPASWMPAPRGVDAAHDGTALADALGALRAADLMRYTGYWRDALVDEDHIRLCPVCQALGYHALFAQISGIERCPIHNVPYAGRCPHCGTPTPPYRLVWAGGPLKCPRCHAWLLPMEASVPRAFPEAFRLQELTAWQSFADWFIRLSAHTDPTPGVGTFPRRVEADEPLDTRARFLWVLHRLEPIPEDTQPYLTPMPRTLRAVRVSNARAQPSTERRQKPDEDGRACKAVLSSIRHHVLRTHLRKHRLCLTGARRFFHPLSDGRGGIQATRKEGGCYTAQAFVFWEQSFHFTRRDAQPDPTLGVRDLLPSPVESVDLRVWAHRVLYAFYERFVAVRLAYQFDARYDRRHEFMLAAEPDAVDFLQRLDLGHPCLYTSSVVFTLHGGDVVVVGRGLPRGLGAVSSMACETSGGHWAHGRRARRCNHV